MHNGNSEAATLPAVSLQGVSKRFRLNPEHDRSVINLLRRPFQRLTTTRRKEAIWFWPLQDVSLDVRPSESLGVLGENGSGKSTLLKIMAGILTPTQGTVEINGRIAALLELGAGFHPDLTGRENIYLNGSILGLRRQEVNQYIQDIIDFAAIDEFIDVPVKFYSSGMRVRLGFSVATFIEPEVMLVDEVLAVGDEDFQRKCVLAFHNFRRRGGTLILVSHSTELIRDMCRRAIWLDEGRIQADGPSSEVIARYLQSVYEKEHQRSSEKQPRKPGERAGHAHAQVGATAAAPAGQGPAANRWGDDAVVFNAVRILNGSGAASDFFYTGDSLTIEADYRVERALDEPPIVGFALIRHDGIWSFGTNTEIEQIPSGLLCSDGQTSGTVVISIPNLALLPGEYSLDLALQSPRGGDHDYFRGCARFTVRSMKRDVGVVRIENHWSFRR